jgi:hypothetical protein
MNKPFKAIENNYKDTCFFLHSFGVCFEKVSTLTTEPRTFVLVKSARPSSSGVFTQWLHFGQREHD